MRKFTVYGPSIIVITTVFVVLLAGPKAVRHLTHAQTQARVTLASTRLADESNILQHINQAYRDIATAVEPSVVHISAQRFAEGQRASGTSALSAGSGWIYDEQGHIVTNHHVVEDAARIDVQLYDGEIRPATIVGFDRSTDIAVIKIEPGRLNPARRADPSVPLRQGDLVFAFGSPFDFRFSMSSGVVSGQGRSVGVIRDQFGERGYENFIQVDAAINPGNSGGPLTDYRGNVVGMNTAIATGPRRRYEEGQFAGVGLAIPIEMIEPVVSQIITSGEVRKGFLGVHILDRGETVSRELSVLGFHGSGVVVVRVDPDMPSVSGVLQPLDIITRVGNPTLTREHYSVDSVAQLLAVLPQEDEMVELMLWRFDAQRDAGFRQHVTMPVDALRAQAAVSLADTDDLISARLKQLGFRNHGVLIPRLDPHGPAARAGLRIGDVLTDINGREVGQSDQVRSLISSMLPGQIVALRIWRYDPVLDTGSFLNLDVPLGQLEPARLVGHLPDTPIRDAIPDLGIARMSTATREATARLGVAFHPGVLLEELVPGSDLERTIPPGSIIVFAMDQPVASVEELVDLLRRVNLLRGAPVVIVDPEGNRITEVLRLQ